MTWWIWLTVAVLLTSIEQVLNRVSLSKHPQHWEYLLGYNAGALLTIVLLLRPDFSEVTLTSLPLLLLSGAAWFMACLFGFKADEHVEVSSTALMTQLQLVLVFLGGLYFFSESASYLKLAGVGLVLFGVSLYGGTLRHAHRLGIFFKMIGVTAMGSALLFDKRLTQLTDAAVIPTFGFMIPMVLAVTLKPHRLVESLEFTRKLRFVNVALGAIGALAYYSLIRAFAVADISTVYPLYQLNLLLTLLIGHYLLSDRGSITVKLAGSAVIILGSLCLSQ